MNPQTRPQYLLTFHGGRILFDELKKVDTNEFLIENSIRPDTRPHAGSPNPVYELLEPLFLLCKKAEYDSHTIRPLNPDP